MPPKSSQLKRQENAGRCVRYDACAMKRRIRILGITLSFGVVVLAAYAIPAVAHNFGPAFFCDAGTLSKCTDTVEANSAEDVFDCEGEARSVVSCTNRTMGNSSWPYCAFMGNETGGEARDAYMCGTETNITAEVVEDFWQQRKAAQGL
jgi:hypothetical protein